MPHRITKSALRKAACRLILELMRGFAESYLKIENFGANADLVVLFAAILIGQIERKPMTASKLAIYAGIPRPSVVRKLRQLEVRGAIKKTGRAAFIPAELVNAVRPRIEQSPLSNILQFACAELSRMDSNGVAGHKPVT